ncbi:MAG: TolC family protein [Holosporales bacterium]|jgi:TolC family type I secretion outer membrane protein|nr:TolC family protein [Holosporales bacterium]
MISKNLLLLFLGQLVVVTAPMAKIDSQKSAAGPKKDVASKDDAASDKKSKNGSKPNGGQNTLKTILESALRYNKDIKVQDNEVKARHEDIASAKAAFLPHLTAEVGHSSSDKKTHSTNKNNDDTPDHRVKDKVNTAKVQATYNLYRGGADKAAYDEAHCQARAAWAARTAKMQQILRDVSVAYFTIIAKQKEVSHLKSLLKARRESSDVARRMLQAGTAKELDVLQADAAASETEAKVAKAESEYTAYCAQFKAMTGMPMPVNPTIPAKMFDDGMSEDHAITIAVGNNPEIRAKIEECSAARFMVKKPNTEFCPSADVTASVEKSRRSSVNKNDPHQANYPATTSCSMGITVTVPIYDGGGGRANVRKAQAILARANEERDRAVDNIKAEVHATWAAIGAAKGNIASATKAVELRERVLHDTMEEYRAGVKIMKDVLEAQSQLFESQSLLIQAEEQYFANQCRALALLGRMDPQYLKIQDSGFDYMDHYKKTRAKI